MMKETKQFSIKRISKHTCIAAALAAGVAIAPSVSYAETAEFIPNETRIVYGNDKPMFDVHFYDEGNASLYTLNPEMKEAVVDGVQYWADLLSPTSRNKEAIDLHVLTMSDQNASASSDPEDSVQAKLCNENWNEDANGVISIGQGQGIAKPTQPDQYGWDAAPMGQLPSSGLQVGLVGVIRHEMGHAFGILVSIQWDGSDYVKDENGYYHFNKTLNSYTGHLYDQNGNQAQAGARIVDDPAQARPGDFVVTPEFTDDNGGRWGGNLYFSGDHVAEVLQGALIGASKVPGIPINGWEIEPEFSHIELGALMSHANYRNYATFIEAELAVLQDMGYVIDRRNSYGYSIYNDGIKNFVNTNGYAARNAAGTGYLDGVYNCMPYGVGLHIYGSDNSVTQAANLLTMGSDAIGIRVDGQRNDLTVGRGTKVHANGKNGIGILVAYGRDQHIVNNGDVRALGDGGVGARFDFGDNALGNAEYRGSYIRYAYDPTFGGDNIALLGELQGPMVESFDISGILAGKAAAISIGANAFVKEINVLDGARLQGDIVSKWMELDAYPNCQIQYSGDSQDLVTNLNFSGRDLSYDGDVKGQNNLRLRVTDGSLRYTGTATVQSAEVLAGAVLLGNASYALADGGALTNHGTLAADPALAGKLHIGGDFVSDGSIGLTALHQDGGVITVDGKASVAGSRLVRINGSLYAPDTTYTFLQADAIDGDIAGGAFSGMLGAQVAVEGTSAKATLTRENHLGNATRLQSDVYGAVDAMYDHLQARQTLSSPKSFGSVALAEMDLLYSLDAEGAKAALTQIGSGPQLDLAGATQRSGWVRQSVATRLGSSSEGYSTNGAVIPLGEDTSGGWWFSMSKHWSRIDGEANRSQVDSHGTDFAVGRDRQIDANWRLGGLFAYGSRQVDTLAGSGENRDYRLGIYGGYRKGLFALDTYAAYGKQANDATNRLSVLGLTSSGRYDSRTLEWGARLSRRPYQVRQNAWQTVPYLDLRVARYTQNAYTEHGAGVFDLRAASFGNTYTTAQVGLEMTRRTEQASYAFDLGYKRALSGYDPSMTVELANGAGQTWRMIGNNPGRDFLVMALRAEGKLSTNWTMNAQAEWERSCRSSDLSAAVRLQYAF